MAVFITAIFLLSESTPPHEQIVKYRDIYSIIPCKNQQILLALYFSLCYNAHIRVDFRNGCRQILKSPDMTVLPAPITPVRIRTPQVDKSQ